MIIGTIRAGFRLSMGAPPKWLLDTPVRRTSILGGNGFFCRAFIAKQIERVVVRMRNGGFYKPSLRRDSHAQHAGARGPGSVKRRLVFRIQEIAEPRVDLQCP